MLGISFFNLSTTAAPLDAHPTPSEPTRPLSDHHLMPTQPSQPGMGRMSRMGRMGSDGLGWGWDGPGWGLDGLRMWVGWGLMGVGWVEGPVLSDIVFLYTCGRGPAIRVEAKIAPVAPYIVFFLYTYGHPSLSGRPFNDGHGGSVHCFFIYVLGPIVKWGSISERKY